jgi:virginiamycin B lyase
MAGSGTKGWRGLVLGAVLAAALMLIAAQRSEAYVYWANQQGAGGGSIGRAELDGSNVDPDFIPANSPLGLAVDDSHIYWGNEDGTIGRANLDGSNVDQSFITGLDEIACGIAVDSAHIYWGASVEGTAIGRADIDGSNVDTSFVPADVPCGVAVDSLFVYWANLGETGTGTTIGRAELDGDDPDQTFITGASFPCGVAVDETSIYWGNLFGALPGATVGRADIDGSDPDHGFILSEEEPCVGAVDDQYVYWADWTDPGSVARAELDGDDVNQAFITAPNVNLVGFLAVDELPLATSLAASCTPSSVLASQASTCTATVTDNSADDAHTPTGPVAFTAAGGSFGSGGTCNLSQSGPNEFQCSVSFIPTSAGGHTIGAAYAGDFAFQPSDGSTSVQATRRSTSTSMSCAPGAVAVSQPSTCTATVTDTSEAGSASAPSGSIAFSAASGSFGSGGRCTLSPAGPRQARCALPYTPSQAGTRQVVGAYGGDAAHAASNGGAEIESSRLTLGAVAKNKRKGTATLTVLAPGPGEVQLAGRGIRSVSEQIQSEGDVLLPVKPTGKARKKLRKKGKAKVSAAVTFTPSGGGNPSSDGERLKLVRRR